MLSFGLPSMEESYQPQTSEHSLCRSGRGSQAILTEGDAKSLE